MNNKNNYRIYSRNDKGEYLIIDIKTISESKAKWLFGIYYGEKWKIQNIQCYPSVS